MTDGPTSEHMRKRALTYIDPRGRPSKPGPSSLELAVEEAAMRLDGEGREDGPSANGAQCREAQSVSPSPSSLAVEGYERKDVTPTLAPLLYAPGGFEHWKLDGGGTMNRVNTVVEVPPDLPPPSNFSAKTTICGIDFEVHREGKHVNLHLYSDEENLERLWTFEPLETAIPKLEAILGAARLAANSA
jgi:hypothetical protein